MLDSYWWSFITMTTVGYGDVIPQTHQGRVIGICCAVFGVIIIGLPIPIITKSFNKFYGVIKKSDSVLRQASPSEESSPRQRNIFSRWWEKRWTVSAEYTLRFYCNLLFRVAEEYTVK